MWGFAPDAISFEDGATLPCEANPGVDDFLLKAITAVVRSIAVGDRAPLEDLVRAWRETGLTPVIDRVFDFDDAQAAFAHLHAARHMGKVVIRVG